MTLDVYLQVCCQSDPPAASDPNPGTVGTAEVSLTLTLIYLCQ